MHIVIVGAQPVGEHLVKLASDAGHSVALIEPDQELAEHCAQHYDIQVLHARIDEEGILDEADAENAWALIATTDDDSVNLMAMVLGREYEIDNLVSTVNSKHRKSLFARLGVNTLVDPELLAARYLLHLTMYPGKENVTPLTGEGLVYEVMLAEDSKLLGRSIGELNKNKTMPKDIFIVLVKREGKRLYPHAEMELAMGDELLLYSQVALQQEELSALTGTAT
ncbi:MAG TPA: TrkA family potassium uptake protein [Salinisphaeraceae bacterium]|nr:TrkA family potassium uptake protein [Salinisphaeraceae bacterium]